MKKTFMFLVLLTFCATGAFATPLGERLASTSLSSGVEGVYYCNNVDADDGTAFVIATANRQGTNTFSTANFVSDIYFHKFADDKYVSSDLPQDWTDFTSAAYDSTWSTK